MVRAQMQTNKSGRGNEVKDLQVSSRSTVRCRNQEQKKQKQKLTGRLGVRSMNSDNKQTTTIWGNRLNKLDWHKWEQVWTGEVSGTGGKSPGASAG